MLTPRIRHRFFYCSLLTVLLVGLAPAAGAEERIPSAAGTYAGEILGVRIDLLLLPDGTAHAAGQTARWSQRGRAVTLVDGGVVEHGTLSGNRLTVKVQGIDIVFERQRGGVAAHGLVAQPSAAPVATRGRVRARGPTPRSPAGSWAAGSASRAAPATPAADPAARPSSCSPTVRTRG